MSTPTNPPVFPTLSSTNVVEGEEERHMLNHYSTDGIALRDLFAAHAITGLLADPKRPASITKPDIAADAYEMADAMLAAREEGS